MADRTFENYGVLSGEYAAMPFENSKSSVVSVTMAEVPFEKTADQDMWFSGELTLTFEMDNTNGTGPLEGITITDTLDATKFMYVADSVIAQLTSGGITTTLVLDTDYTVTYTPDTPAPGSDLLKVDFLNTGDAASIAIGSILTLSFRGEKVPVTP